MQLKNQSTCKGCVVAVELIFKTAKSLSILFRHKKCKRKSKTTYNSSYSMKLPRNNGRVRQRRQDMPLSSSSTMHSKDNATANSSTTTRRHNKKPTKNLQLFAKLFNDKIKSKQAFLQFALNIFFLKT